MLTPRSALLELIALAHAWPLSESPANRRRMADDPRAVMIAAVAAECQRTLDKDPVLRTVESPLPKLLHELLERWSSAPPQRGPGDLAKLESATDLLDQTYADDVDKSLLELSSQPSGRYFALSTVCVAAVSELRSRGWSDDGLRAWFDQFDEGNAIDELRRLLHKKPRRLVCHVPVSGWDEHDFSAEGMTLAERIDQRMVAEELPPGPYLEVALRAHDEADAAERAFARARRVLDAVALVRPEIAESWASPIVGVESGSKVGAYQVGRWRGSLEPLSTTVEKLAAHDALGEACRYRVQAMQLRDPITRLSLLWLGLERLVQPPGDFPDALAALRHLVPRAMALTKVRAEMGALAAAVKGATVSDEVRGRLPGDDPSAWLELLQKAPNDKLQPVVAALAKDDLRLALWIEQMRAHMQGPNPQRLQRFFEATRQRIEWQMLRLHRAHTGQGMRDWPLAWVHDLSLHVHHYLTSMLVTVMASMRRNSSEVLGRRAAQYDLFVGLLDQGDRRAQTTKALLDPTTLVGKGKLKT